MPEKSGPPPPNETITVSSGSHTTPPDLRFLHYNDVYHVESSSAEPVGGAARFQTLVDHYRSGDDFSSHPELLTFFSGDAFNPSLESAVTKGSHMVPILNNIGTDVAALGNHDLDFGVTQFNRLAAKCKFPWLIANVLDPALGDDVPIGGIPKTLMLTASNGIKVGVIGLGEREWLSTINSLPPDIIYKSASATAEELVPKLRAEGAEIIVAVTHMREPNDNKLAENTDGIIDIILGGHDHYYNHSLIKGTHVLRSGTDFKQLSYIEARRSTEKPGRWDFDIIRRDITSEIPAHEETAQLIDKHTAALKTKLNKIIGYTAAPLDARFRTVRLRESNISNWVCDIMRHYYGGDCALMASGTVRGDQIYPPGPILLKDIMNCFPFEDPVVVIMASGQQIWDALENGVSQYPALEGRFPQVSNINFEFDATKPPGSRIVSASMGGSPFDMGKQYKLVTRGYMGRGKDGYDSLLIEAEGGTTREIVSEENGILISMMLRQYFMSLRVMGQWKYWGKHIGGYWNNVSEKVGGTHLSSAAQSPVESRTTNLSTNLPSRNDWSAQKIRERKAQGQPADDSDSGEDDDAANENERIDREMAIVRRVAKKWTQRAGIKCSLVDELHDEEIEVDWTRAIAPHVEGRIVCVAGEHAS